MPKIPHVYLDKKSGLWYFVASMGYDSNGKRIQKWGRGYKTQNEAKLAYEKYINDFSDTSVRINSTMSYKEFYTTYFIPDYKFRVKPQTYDNRISASEKHLKHFFNKKLKDINPPLVKRWQNELASTYSPGYVRLVYGLFQKSLDLAVQLGLVQKNIAKQVGNVKKKKSNITFWTLSEAKKVFETFDKENYYELYSFTLIYTLFMTGIRIGEAQALTWEDVNLEDKWIKINKTMYYKSSDEYFISEPKTSAGIRTISLDDNTITHLKAWKETQSINISTNFVFSYNGSPTNRNSTRGIIIKHSNRAKVHQIKTHALRHSHASLLVSLGENPLIIKERLGHEDLKTTLSTYSHLYPNAHREVATKLNKVFK